MRPSTLRFRMFQPFPLWKTKTRCPYLLHVKFLRVFQAYLPGLGSQVQSVMDVIFIQEKRINIGFLHGIINLGTTVVVLL